MKLIPLVRIILFAAGFCAIGLLAIFSSRQPTQQSAEPFVVCIIQYNDLLNPVADGFKAGMEELGYLEGRDIIYQFESSSGNKERIAQITNSYISRNVDLIYAITSVAAREALAETIKQGRGDIPIVYAHADNPVATGLAASLKSSQNNTAGVAVDLKELTGKKLEFLRDINPGIRRVGVFTAAYSDPATALVLEELRSQALKFDIELVEYHLQNPPGATSTQELLQTTGQIQQGDIHALFQTPGPVANQQENVEVFIAFAKRLRIPSVFTSTPQIQQGGLFAYSHDFFSVGKQSAHIAQKVLNGTPPPEIPIEFPKDNILAINFKTAREIGIFIPEPMLTLVTMEFEK